MAASHFTIDILNMPEAIWAMRREMAHVLREQADAEVSTLVATRLREIATMFEAGSTDIVKES